MILMYRFIELSHLLCIDLLNYLIYSDINFSQIKASDSTKLENSTHVDTTRVQINITDVNDVWPKFEKGNHKHTFLQKYQAKQV